MLILKQSLQESLQITYWRTMSGRSASDGNKILNLHCLADSGDTCVVFEGGDIVLVRQDPVVEVEIVGSAENKIVAAAWSPDDEVLALLTNGNSLLLMSRDFEPIEEVILTTEDLKASRHVSVGWGKSETQFQGKHAKAMRDPTMPEKVDRGERSPQDDGRTSISWRGDGAFLAVSSFEGEDRRVIRVYNREAQLDSVSEPVDGLESHISWRPAGNLIAGIQRFPDRVDVVFFERNGLRHGEFTLKTGEGIPSKSLDVRDVLWNGDSTILAVCLADRVQLWSMGNYHWYLKQELMVPVFGQRYLLVGHPEKPLKFAIISSSMKYSGTIFIFVQLTLLRGSFYK
jgi:elongator complex protein 1